MYSSRRTASSTPDNDTNYPLRDKKDFSYVSWILYKIFMPDIHLDSCSASSSDPCTFPPDHSHMSSLISVWQPPGHSKLLARLPVDAHRSNTAKFDRTSESHLNRDRFPSSPLKRGDHLQDWCALSNSEVVDFRSDISLFFDSFQRLDMATGQVNHMDKVTDTCTVFGIVIIPVDSEVEKLSGGYLKTEGVVVKKRSSSQAERQGQ